MTRQLLPVSGYSTNPATEVQAAVVGIVEFLEIDLPTGNLYLTNAQRAYAFGGNTYTPVTASGTPFGTVSNYNEGTDAVPRPMRISLSGCDQTVINNLASNNVQWVKIVWSLGFMDANGNLVNGTPFFTTPLFLGDCTITLGKNTGTLTISAENLLADLQNRQSGCLQTEQDQQQRGSLFSSDSFYSYCASLVYTFIYWGMIGPARMGIGAGAGVVGTGGGNLAVGSFQADSGATFNTLGL